MNKYKFLQPLVLLSVLTILGGCATDYPCGEPSNGHCASVSDNYKHSFNEYTNLDDTEPVGMFGSSDSSSSSQTKPIKVFNFTKHPQIPADGAPLISRPTLLRVWVTPYTDSDNVFHDQSYEYVLTDKGHWLYSNNKLADSSGFKNVTLIQSTNTALDGNRAATQAASAKPPTSNNIGNPNTLLNDFPAINALKPQSAAPVTMSTMGGVNRTTILP